VDGVDDEVSATLGGGAATWTKVVLALTPSEDGVVSLYWEAQGGTTYSAYADDLEIAVTP
jgi:hypothetical protein